MPDNYAVFIDLENAGGNKAALISVMEKLRIKGEILISNAYGYCEAYEHLKETLISNTFRVIPSIRYGAVQKNNLDIQLVVDAMEVAYTNPLINCFCIVSGDSDYTPLVGKLKSLGKHVLGISRSAVASKVFINACSEFIFLETVNPKPKIEEKHRNDDDDADWDSLAKDVERVIYDQGDDESCIYASVLKTALLRLKPDFNERDYGCNSFSKLMQELAKHCDSIVTEKRDTLLLIKLYEKGSGQRNSVNWLNIAVAVLDELKSEGFSTVNPSILKVRIQQDYPDFSEEQCGFRKFSDMLKELEKRKLLRICVNDQKNMLVTIC